MKKFKKIINILLYLNLIWVILITFAIPVKIEKVKDENLAKAIVSEWESLKRKNLIHGAILIQKGKNIIYKDGDINRAYKVGSISKSFTGYLFYQKEKNGDLNLDTPACNWLSNLCKGELKNITLNHLLNHTSGFGHDLSILHFLERSFSTNWDRSLIDKINFKDSDLNFLPGTDFEYSNFGYNLLTRILEKIEKKSFDEIIAKLAKDRNLPSLNIIKKGDIYTNSILIPFTQFQDINFHTESDLYKDSGAGGVLSSASDLSKWLDILDESFIEDSFSTKEKKSYVKGIVPTEEQSYESYWHNGAVPGNYALMAIIPKTNLKVVILLDNFKFIKQWKNNLKIFEQYFY